MSTLLDRNATELRTLRRRRSRDLRELDREQLLLSAELDREIERLRDLENKLATSLNQTHIATLLETIEPVAVAAPAVPRAVQKPRGILQKTVLAALLGGMVGLMIALFRSVSP